MREVASNYIQRVSRQSGIFTSAPVSFRHMRRGDISLIARGKNAHDVGGGNRLPKQPPTVTSTEDAQLHIRCRVGAPFNNAVIP